jgi:uncharacterized protein with FMN-binding domain
VRRAIPAIILTLIGLAALATFKTTPGTPASQKLATAAPTTTPLAPTTAPPAGASPPPGATSSPTAAPPTTATGAVRTVDGDPVDNRYGTVQVRVTLQGNTITDVTALQMPNDRQRSAFISEQAGPYLRQEALQAQSAQIDIVSGATFTSESYAQSLQSALSRVQ